MKKRLAYTLLALPFLSFNPQDHIVPDTEHEGYRKGQLSPEGYEFPNDPQSNNYFNDPNWPRKDPNAKFNNTPEDSYYTSPNGANQPQR